MPKVFSRTREKANMTVDLENHKGEWCVIKPEILCQEGYCSECQIYKDHLKDNELTDNEIAD